MTESQEFARPIPIPYKAEYVMTPEIFYGRRTAVVFPSEDEEFHVRLSFENLDAIKVCRGEHLPYDYAERDTETSLMFIVENSSWLRERHAYESRHYRNFYEWGNNVDDMLSEFDHYLFAFHDEFIEFIAAGIWFEKSRTAFAPDTPFAANTPYAALRQDLPEECIIEEYEKYGIQCQVRRAKVSEAELFENSKLCSQPLFHFAIKDDEETFFAKGRFNARTRNGNTSTTFTGSMGKVLVRKDGIISVEEAKELMDAQILAPQERRKEMGK